ncbi:hypothetical protein TSAR_016060 [Trichomalopsis sarcophagae]|uniref:Ubiquitin-like protease family profile domain-containing protein n=1 Tax=Trichomalopsis sarcophagae TaxID=543379 RepID=A0A232EE23_9HYME|nr:hypothetical protein TSAR_016060 [Trichomalopsis sarcophagae]
MLTESENLIVRGINEYSGSLSMLLDTRIFKFNQIIESKTPFSMQSSLLIQKPHKIRPVPIDYEYIQILFSGNNKHGHWIYIWYHFRFLTNDCIIYINRLFPYNKNIKISFEDVEFQQTHYDCGIFSIAFSTSIIFNICPCGLQFDINKMRKHLSEMYYTRSLQMFPLSNNSYENITLTSIPLIRNVLHFNNFQVLNLNFQDIDFEDLE